MEVIKVYKVRLYPNKTQEQELLKMLAGCRFVWNHFLALRRDYYLENKKTLPYAEMSRQLTKLRKSAPELKDIQLHPLGQTLRRLDVAYNRFFRKQSRFPSFKKEYSSKQSFQKSKDWRIVDGKIKLQNDFLLNCRGHLPSKTVKKIGTIVVSYVAQSKWYASITVKEDIKTPKRHSKPIGIDLGIKSLATISDGKKYEVKKHGLDTQLAVLHRKLSRQKIGSNRRNETRKQLARLYHRIDNIKRDSLHKTSDMILKKNPSLVAIEDLAVSNMMKNHRLARSIANASWGELVRQIEYKAVWRGGEIVRIDRFFPSSKTCSKCFYIADSLPLSIREWSCPQCGTKHDRDINAAKVILQQGQGMPRVESRIGTEKSGGIPARRSADII